MPRHKKFHLLSGFTLAEILIVVAIIVIISGIMFGGSIQSSLQKARDNKRKQDLSKILRLLEDYNNDKGDYPAPNYPPDGKIMGAAWGSPFLPYAPQLPQDPTAPFRNYYYQAKQGEKRFFVIYAKLENSADPDIVRVDCQNGCGPIGRDGKRAYNFYVSSQDVVMLAGIPPGYDPGRDPESFPSPTLAPTTIPTTPSPTFNPSPPIAGNTPCVHNQCCSNHNCGNAIKPPGVDCGGGTKCWYESIVPPFGWECKDAATPPEQC